LLEACGRAMSAWADRKRWRRIMARGMAADHAWDGPAAEYEAAYERAVGVQSA
ncbi:MAG: glycogen synthase, starch synthase, partial [Chloroflexi bacterium CSP1-4]